MKEFGAPVDPSPAIEHTHWGTNLARISEESVGNEGHDVG